LPSFFDIKNIFFSIWGYEMSHLEFWATISGALAVWLSVKENVWSWILGLVNVCFACVMFYQIWVIFILIRPIIIRLVS
jgi:nicotinamide mononucleotide transporter